MIWGCLEKYSHVWRHEVIPRFSRKSLNSSKQSRRKWRWGEEDGQFKVVMRRINSFATSSEMITELLKVSAVQLKRCCEGRKLLVANRQRNRMCIDIMRVGSFLLDRATECAKLSWGQENVQKSQEGSLLEQKALKILSHNVSYLVVVVRALVQMVFLPLSDSALLSLVGTSKKKKLLPLSDSACFSIVPTLKFISCLWAIRHYFYCSLAHKSLALRNQWVFQDDVLQIVNRQIWRYLLSSVICYLIIG